MIQAGLWKDRDARRPRPYQPRYRRDCRGELIQVDGSKHWWFEDRGPQCTLLVYIDDASSELMQLRMVESESTFAYMEATREYIERHGKPVAFCSDKHSVFRNAKASAKGDGMTHFGRALEALNIEIICANSPQAKGRVERANGTLQDRLVKAMRLEGIATIAEANAFLPAYMQRHNQRFAKPPFDARDLHRPLAPHDDLRAEMVWREQRTVTSALTLHYNKALFILDPTEISRPLAGKRVDVCEYPDGRLEIRHGEHALPYRVFDKIRQVNQAAIVENKHLDAALAMAKAMQSQLPVRKRNANEPTVAAGPHVRFPGRPGRAPREAQARTPSPAPAHPDRGGAAHAGTLLSGPTASSGSGWVIARPAHQQGLRCARWRGSTQPLLHQTVTSLSSGNRDFSVLQEQIKACLEEAFISPRHQSCWRD